MVCRTWGSIAGTQCYVHFVRLRVRVWTHQMASGPVVIVDRRTCVLLVTIRECIDMHFVVKMVLCVNHLGFIKGRHAF